MIYIKFFIFSLFQIAIDLASYPLAPIVALFGDADGNLPRWLSLFSTYDNTLDGDDGYKQEHRFFPANANGFQRWANRTGWLWRNPAYGFDMLLGASCQAGQILSIEGDRRVSDNPYHPGSCFWRIIDGNGSTVAFQLYWVHNFTATTCIRVNLGWKLWNLESLATDDPWPVGNYVFKESGTAQLVMTPGINPRG